MSPDPETGLKTTVLDRISLHLLYSRNNSGTYNRNFYMPEFIPMLSALAITVLLTPAIGLAASSISIERHHQHGASQP